MEIDTTDIVTDRALQPPCISLLSKIPADGGGYGVPSRTPVVCLLPHAPRVVHLPLQRTTRVDDGQWPHDAAAVVNTRPRTCLLPLTNLCLLTLLRSLALALSLSLSLGGRCGSVDPDSLSPCSVRSGTRGSRRVHTICHIRCTTGRCTTMARICHSTYNHGQQQQCNVARGASDIGIHTRFCTKGTQNRLVAVVEPGRDVPSKKEPTTSRVLSRLHHQSYL
jgi:hypothetical protein